MSWSLKKNKKAFATSKSIKATILILAFGFVLLVPSGTAHANGHGNALPNNFWPYEGIRQMTEDYNDGTGPYAGLPCENNPDKYGINAWISPRDDPGNPGPYRASYGQQVFQLDFRSLVFLCKDRLVGWAENGTEYRSVGLPNDGTPDSGQTRLVRNYTYVSDTSVRASDGSSGFLSPNGAPKGGEIVLSRDLSTRYWISGPLAFDYVSDAPVTRDVWITIRLEMIQMNEYAGPVYGCISSGNLGTSNRPGYGCGSIGVEFSILLDVPEANSPEGSIDVADCTHIAGWAADRDDLNANIEVHIYVDGVGYNYGTTNVYRPDVTAHFGGGSDYHGYDWPWPPGYKDGNSHTVDVYAINVGNGDNTHLGTRSVGPCLDFNQTIDVYPDRPQAYVGDTFSVTAYVRNSGPTRSNSADAWVDGDGNAINWLTCIANCTGGGTPYVNWNQPGGCVASGSVCTSRTMTFRVNSNLPSTRFACFQGYVQPYRADNFGPYVDTFPNNCIRMIVPRRPYFSTYGGDTHAGAVIGANCSNAAAADNESLVGRVINERGSRSQFGLSATGAISMVTAAIASFGSANDTRSPDGSYLTFGNVGGAFGEFYKVVCRPDYTEIPTTGTLNGNVQSISSLVSNPANNGKVLRWTDNMGVKTLNGGDIPAGFKLTIISEAPVLINGNIRYLGVDDNPSYTSRSDIPAFALVSGGNIGVDQNVTRLHGLYSSNGTFSTCSNNAPTPLVPVITNNPNSNCLNQLRVYGMVMADNFYFRRIIGDASAITATPPSTDDLTNAAEIFRLPAEFFLSLPPGFFSPAGAAQFKADLPPLF